MDPVRTLLNNLQSYRILEAGQLDEVYRSILPHYRDDARGLMTDLLKRQWVTPYQLNRLGNGRGEELVVGNYVLEARIGEGGMGQVFKARNWKLGRTVALKLIRKELLGNPVAAGRFRREIEAAGQVDHPNIIRAFDAGETDDRLYIVMEYVDGIDLARLIEQEGMLTPGRACEYVRQVATALQHVYEKGLIHRDIKPPNLMRTNQGDLIKVLDLGLARLQEPADIDRLTRPGLTQIGMIVGTLDFIAPEQARDSRFVDIRADLYSLGCTFHFLLTGRPPFPGGTPTEKLLRHSVDPPPLLNHLSPAVSAIVRRLMAKKPEERHQTPADLVAELTDILADPQQLVPTSRLVMTPTVPLVSLPAPKQNPSPEQRAKKTRGAIPTNGTRRSAKVKAATPPARRPSDDEPTAAAPPVARLVGPATERSAVSPFRVTAEGQSAVIIVRPQGPPRRRFLSRTVTILGLLVATSLAARFGLYPLLADSSDQRDERALVEPEKPHVVPERQHVVTARECWALGPIPGVIRGIEALEIDPDPSRPLIGPRGEKIPWRTLTAMPNGLFREEFSAGQRWGRLYALFDIESPIEQDAVVLLGPGDLLALWINGEQIYESRQMRTARAEGDRVNVHLKRGPNKVLLRQIVRPGSACEWSVRVEGIGDLTVGR